jgi:hypothetical protein
LEAALLPASWSNLDAASRDPVEVADGRGNLWREFPADEPGTLFGSAGQAVRKIEFFAAHDEFSVACEIRPQPQQAAHANLFSCHTADFHGIACEAGGEPARNQFGVAIGDGKQWLSVGAPFELLPGELYLVMLTVTHGEVRVRIVGRNVDFARAYALSREMTLENKLWCWGDWIHRGRSFAGSIKLIRLEPAPFEAATVASLIRQYGPEGTQ